MSKIEVKPDGTLVVPHNPTIPFVTGDGVGVEITPAMQQVLDAAVEKAYGGSRKVIFITACNK
ncbi:MAG: hypothetical protein II338_03560 [Bacteroidaceae bacterium]|nr:hypothetical protein [Bacteroidaceae bacterium]